MCVFEGYLASNFVKKNDVTNIKKLPKFQCFDRKSRPRPFQTMSLRLNFFAFLWNETVWIALTCYRINSKITKLGLF